MRRLIFASILALGSVQLRAEDGPKEPWTGEVRVYYIAADEVAWNYAPAGNTNRFHSINGFVFGNLPMMRMKNGEHVRWYLVALGGEHDLHTPHWHGNTVLHEDRRTDVIELLPASMKVADMRADNPGIWLFHCHVGEHVKAGMAGRYEVEK